MENTAVSRTPWRIQQYREGGRGHNSCRPRRTLPSPPPSKQENTAVPSGTEVAQRYRTPYDHTLDSTVQTRENSSIYLEERRGHHSTRPRRTIPSTPPSTRENTAVSRGREGAQQDKSTPPSTQNNTAVPREREGAPQYQTPEDHTLHSTVKTIEYSSIGREGGGTTVAPLHH